MRDKTRLKITLAVPTPGVVLILILVLALASALALGACAKKNQKDAFQEKWDKKRDEVQNNTYTPTPHKVDFSQLQVKGEVKPSDLLPKRELPTMRVSLNFYNTDLQAVLRSMARIANQNIVLSAALQTPENQGKFKVNLNVSETPWDQAFNSILNANGLSYDWDGEIIRVMTLDDLKAQNEMKKAIGEKLAQNEKIKNVEPMVTVKIQVNYADVEDLEKTLQGYLAIPKAAGGAAGGAAGAASGAAAGAAPGASGGGEELAGKIKGMVVADKHSNSILIQATRENAEMLVKLVEKLDEPRLQVHLKAFIVEASRTSMQDIGIQWGGIFHATSANGQQVLISPGGNSAPQNVSAGAPALGNQLTGAPTATSLGTQLPIYGNGPAGSGYGLNFPAAITPSVTGLGSSGAALNFLWGMIGGNVLQTQLTALASDGKANILAEPSLTTLDNNMAFTENGEKVPFVSTSQNGTNVQFVDAVLRLEMTPHVIDDRNVRLKITVKDDEVDTTQTDWVQGNPPIFKKETDTTLIVEDGSTIIISGLAKHSKSTGDTGVPGAKNIPGLGNLFKESSRSSSKDDLWVFITPTVLRSPVNSPDAPQPASQSLGQNPGRPTGTGSPAPGSGDRQPMPLGMAPAAPGVGRPGS
jgi:type IV pilus assembly protein PilQ